MQQNKTREIEVTDSIVDTVIDKFVTRAKFGKNKYGTRDGYPPQGFSQVKHGNHLPRAQHHRT